MAGRFITIEVTSDDQEAMARQAAALQREIEDLADGVEAGSLIDACELAAVDARDEFGKQMLGRAVRRRVDALEKKTPPSDAAPAADAGSTEARPKRRSGPSSAR